MYPRNAATPPTIAVGSIYLIADGTLQTSGASVRVITAGGAWGAGGGTLGYDTTSGAITYVPTQAETNGEWFIVSVYKASCTSASVTVVTTASATAGRTMPADGSITAAVLADAAIDNATFAADVGSTAYATNIVALAVRKVLDELNLDHLAKTATVAADMTTEVADNTILSRILANGDTSAFDPSTDGLQPIRDRGDAAWVTATGFLTTLGSTAPAGWIDAAAIADNAIDAGAIAANAITDGKIATGAITAAKFAAAAITSTVLADDAITAAKFDESTAFPLAAADSGATYVARAPSGTQTLDSLAASIAGIGSGTGAALNFACTTDSGETDTLNAVSKVGTVPSATEYLKTTADNAVYEVITAAGSAIDWVYKFSVGSGRVASKVTFNGYLLVAGPVGTKAVNVYAWNFTGTPAWNLVGVIAGQTGTTDITRDITLLSAHTGTGADAGIIYLRFTNSGAVTSLNVDALIAQAQNLGQNAGYTGGYVYLDTTGGGTSGTTPFVNGIESKPCTTIAEAYSIAAAVGVRGIYLTPGSSATLTQSAQYWKFYGGTISLASQSIADALFENCYTVQGVSSGDDYKMIRCGVGTMTGAHGYFWNCAFKGTFTMLSGGQAYYLFDCSDGTNAATACSFVFAANAEFMARGWTGGINLDSMSSTNTAIIDGAGRITIADTSVGGSLTIRGAFPAIVGGAGYHTAAEFIAHGGTVSDTARMAEDQNIGIDWSNVSNQTSIVGLSGTTINDVTTKTGYTAAPTAGSIVTASFGTCVLPETTKTNLLPAVAAGAKSGLPILDAATGLILTGYGAGAVTTSPTAGSIVTASFGTCVPPAPTGMSTLTQTQVSGGAYDLTNATFVSAFKAALGTVPASGNWSTATDITTAIPHPITMTQVGGVGPYYVEVLDNSGAAVAPASTALSTTTWTGTKAGYLDVAISTRGTGTSTHTAADVAALVLATPANKLATDASGYVTFNNASIAATGDWTTDADLTTFASTLATAHGSGSWATATGFALASDWTGTRAGYLDAAVSTRQATVTNLANAVTMAAQFATMVVLDGAVYDFTAAALAAAPTSGLDAAGVRTALGMASADLDAQLDAILAASTSGEAINITTETTVIESE